MPSPLNLYSNIRLFNFTVELMGNMVSSKTNSLFYSDKDIKSLTLKPIIFSIDDDYILFFSKRIIL